MAASPETHVRLGPPLPEPDLRGAVPPWSSTTPLFHGTRAAPFAQFDLAHAGSARDEGFLGRGVYLSTDPNVVRPHLGERRVEATAELHHPLYVAMTRWEEDKRSIVSTALGLPAVKGGAELTAALVRCGYDSVVLDYGQLGYQHREVMVINPRQIRLTPPAHPSPALD